MKQFFKASVAAAALMLCSMGTASAETIKVGIAAEPYPPFTSPDASGKWDGWEIRIVMAICEAAELDCVITPVSWDGIIPALNTKKIDIITASMGITEDRKKSIDFSDKYYNTQSVILGSKDMEIEPTPEGLKDKIIGVQVSTIYQTYANKYFADTAAEIKEYQTQDEANQDLAAGRIDATQADSLALIEFAETEAGKACCEIKGPVAVDLEILGPGVAIGIRKGEAELQAKLNKAIKTIRANGKYDEITKEYFNFDIFGD